MGFFCHNGSKQGKGARKQIYINLAIFGEERRSVLRMDEAWGGGTQAVCAQFKTQVTAGNLQPHVTYNPPRSRQEAAAEYFLFLSPCRRQTGATLGMKESEVWKRRAKHSSSDLETC